MSRRTRIGYVLVAVGVGIGLLSLGFGGGTDRACPDIDSVVYETIGIQPSGAAITGIRIGDGTVEWYDGCNRRTNSFVSLVVGGLVSTVGVLFVRGTDQRDAATGA